jgi:chromosome segregation ATPase
VKSFFGETKIFERADSLRITLEGRIDEMKNALKEMQAQRKEVKEIGGQLAGNRKMAEDLQARLARFAAERRRIEDMDTDFRRLLTISQDVDLRVQSLQSSQDALQAIQAKIHDLENLEKVIETRYDRLEKKKGILDSTTEGVDRSFQLLENLGQALKTLQGDVQGFSRQAAGMKREVEMLITNREKADAVIGKLAELDQILGGLEERVGKFETSREWLARTETRFEQVSREAEEQVSLLQSILKKEAAGPEKEKETGAPPLGKREQVIKLAHQGWSSREIAKVTKLSRGEVELILELAPRN